MNLSQARWQVVTVWGVLDPQIGLREVGQGLPGGLLARGGVDGFDSGGDLLAVPVGDEPHPGARNRVDHAGGDRGLGPGLPAFASGRPVSPSHSPARVAPVREVPPSTIRHAPTLRLCRHGRTHAPRRRLLPRPGPRSLSHVLDPVHAPPRPRYGPSGRRPGEQARTIGPDRARGRSPGRGLVQRTRAATRATASATASAGPRNGPRGQLHAERGGQVVLNVAHFSIPPAHQAW